MKTININTKLAYTEFHSCHLKVESVWTFNKEEEEILINDGEVTKFRHKLKTEK